ncbi:PLP-dependent aminotransferase family protein [Symmachiella dynata]|uniref:aminotransferase-like domain-containing protein n=1 Tax=Symmachiella dynata TaxID=2527995 RepID=UPI0030ED52BA
MSTQQEKTNAPPPSRLSLRRHWGGDQPISFLMQQGVANPDCISLAAGLVDQGSLPAREVQAALQEMLADDHVAKRALQYGTTHGNAELRGQLLGHLAGLEHVGVDQLGVDVNQVILTTGSQQLLSIVGEILLDPEDIVLVAAPTYFVYLGTLNGLGARIIPVATDEDGMRMDALEAKLEEIEAAGDLERVKLIYLVSYYENPSGVSLSAQRRAEAVAIAQRWSKSQRIYILEDAAYRELRYDGPELPSIWSFDTDRHTVILAKTFSKTFAPGLRIGFGVVPAELERPICDRKGNEDFGSANFNQHLLSQVFRMGLYDSHVAGLREMYTAKRDAMLRAAETYFGDIPGVSWVHPHGGLYVWITLPESCDTSLDGRLFREAVQTHGVMYVPGEFSFAGERAERPNHHMRLSYGVQDAAGIDLGMQRLAAAVKSVLAEA